MESIVSQQVFAAWVQTAGLVVAASIALFIYGLHSFRTARRARTRDRLYFDRVLMLAQHARKLFHKGELACSLAGTLPPAKLLGMLDSERRSLIQALHLLPLEHAPDAALFYPILKLRVCLTEMGEGLASPAQGDARHMFRCLHRRADAAATRIDALCKLHFAPPRLPLKRRSEVGMPTTTVDEYATFKFLEAVYLEPDCIDFEVLVNNQSVRCTISHDELDRLIEANHPQVRSDFRRHPTIFRQQRELIWRTAEYLIRAGARSPVDVTYTDIKTVQSAPAPAQTPLKIGEAIY